MTSTTSPDLPAIPTPTPVRPAAEMPPRLGRLLSCLALVVAVFDCCFWRVNGMGFSVAVFILALAGLILANREGWTRRKSSLQLLALLAGAAVAAAIETSTTNAICLVLLTILLAGDTWFGAVESPWGRSLSQAVACLMAPGRVFWLSARLMEVAFGGGLGWTGGVIGGCLMAIPAIVLALIFGTLLGIGNAVFGNWTSNFFDWFWKELALCLDPARIVLWLFVAFLAMPLLRPANVSSRWYKWTQNLPRFPELIPNRAAFYSNVMTLVVLNLVFLIANYADALFLWSGAAMPAGVPYKSYVHEGVNVLIVTVILTAVVLTAIFHQSEKVANKPLLKGLALFWIVQNVFLMASVALRIRHYIETYEMTVARLGVLIFLLLVATGFALLTIKIMKGRSLSWLVGGCLAAVFATFYITQFLNLAGWSCDYNIARWEADPTHRIDLWKFYEYGPDAWPALKRARKIDPAIAMLNEDPNHGFITKDEVNLARFDWQHWREFGLRACWNSGALEDKK